MDDELLAYYDEIRRLAEAKSDSREEAEDLLSETFLQPLRTGTTAASSSIPKPTLCTR